jgi:hypothetical protein
MNIKAFSLALAMFASLSWAQFGAPVERDYEERPSIGGYFEYSIFTQYDPSYMVQGQEFEVEGSSTPVFGLGAHMPINNNFGLQGLVGFQKHAFDFAIKDAAYADSVLAEPNFFIEDDFNGTLNALNVVVQLGMEFGYVINSSFQTQTMNKILIYGGGVTAKTFYGQSKMNEANLWGYSYGLGYRHSVESISFTAGVRGFGMFPPDFLGIAPDGWKSHYAPEYASEDVNDDTFSLEYASISPYIKVAVSLY